MSLAIGKSAGSGRNRICTLAGLALLLCTTLVTPASAVEVEPFKQAPLLFGFEWELPARLSSTTASGKTLLAPPTVKGVEFARVGRIAWTTDYPQVADCTKTLELISDPITMGDFDALVADFKKSRAILETFADVPEVSRGCQGKKQVSTRALNLANNPGFTRAPDFPAATAGNTANIRGVSQHATYPIMFGSYHKDMLTYALRAERARAAIQELNKTLRWKGLSNRAKDTWLLFLMAVPVTASGKKNELSPMPRSEIRDLFHAIKDPKQRLKFAKLRRYCPGWPDQGKGPSISNPRIARDYKKLWDWYCLPQYFGDPVAEACPGAGRDIQAMDDPLQCDAYGALPQKPYKPFYGDNKNNLYMLVEERLQSSVSTLDVDDPESIAKIKSELTQLMAPKGKRGSQVQLSAANEAQEIPQWSDSSPRINLWHVFEGEINRRGKASGFHARPGGKDPKNARIKSIKDGPNGAGVYTAFVEVRKKSGWVSKFSSLFPDRFSRSEVVEVILHAYNNRKDPTKQPWSGPSGHGFQVQGYTTPEGDINTAFPVYRAN